MVVKLSTKQLEEIIRIVAHNVNQSNSYIDLIKTKNQVTEYLQLPDLFNCE